jgi:ABC-2 type transport system ATP-binding protein
MNATNGSNADFLVVDNLTKSFGSTLAVDGISLKIQRGEFFGLLGPNGAGKSTTISMMAGLLRPTGGQISMGGKDLLRNLNWAKQRIGLVPQDLALYPTLSARDNLAFFGQIYGLKGAGLKNRIKEVLEIVQLSERADEPVEHYSGGMKRRVNLAAGLLHRPEILFLDEPTVGVDPQSRNAIFESVEILNREGLTILYTTHYMEEAERLCQRVAIVDHGKIIALDTPAALIDHFGQGLIQMEIYDGKVGQVHEQIQQLGTVQSILRKGQQLEIRSNHFQETLVNAMQITNHLNARISSLNILEANLETVFLSLTGKTLRE